MFTQIASYASQCHPKIRALANGRTLHQSFEVVSDCLCYDCAVHALDLFYIPECPPSICPRVVWGGEVIELFLGRDDRVVGEHHGL